MGYSVMQEKMKLVDLMRAQSVKRWTIVHTTKQQSLAEHTFNVVMIARAICSKLGIEDAAVIKGAMVHDLDEIMTGDIPTPFKKEARSQGIELNDIMRRVSHTTLTPLEEAVIKAADILEANWFIKEFGSGTHAGKVAIWTGIHIEEFIEKMQLQTSLLESFDVDAFVDAVDQIRSDLEGSPTI